MDDLPFFWDPMYSPRNLAKELTGLRTAQRRATRNRARSMGELRDELDVLRGELEFVTLTLGAPLAHVEHTGGVIHEELRERMIAADGFDGKLDGRMPVAVLQELLRPAVLEENPGDDSTPTTAPNPSD